MAAIRSSLVLNSERHLDARPEIDEEFRVVETAGVAAIVGTANLAHDLFDLGKVGPARGAPALRQRYTG